MFELPELSHTVPTAYEDVNAALNVLLSKCQVVLGSRLVGLYLYGSLASGDFHPHSSDIDFVTTVFATHWS